MAFQRSYSKVWWGNSDESSNFYYYNQKTYNQHQQHNSEKEFYSLDSHFKIGSGNLSNIEEVDEPSSKLWRSHESPGSLRSQDSGFSDNDDSHKHLSKSHNSPSSPASSVKTIETPPTVLRRKPDDYNLNVSKRISFSAPSSPTSFTREVDVLSQIDRISLLSNTPQSVNEDELDIPEKSSCKCTAATSKDRSIRRRRFSGRRVRKSLIQAPSEELNDISMESLNTSDATVYLGFGDDNNNVSVVSEKDSVYAAISSTPKKSDSISHSSSCDINEISTRGITLPYYSEYPNPLLNGHSTSVQHWLDEIRMSYNHEVMSTLQTKSIAQEAFRNLKITSATVAKIVRQLQTRSLILQGEFERVEKFLRSEIQGTVREALQAAEGLIASVVEFVKVLERRSVFFTECRDDRKKFDDNIEHIKFITKDLRISLEKQHYLDLESLFEDINVLKRYVLITLRLVFEKLIRVIVLSIENSTCDLMLRANLNMVATLSNVDYTGFASLNDAFMRNEAIRVFLLICLDSKFSSIRALALRALATVCSSSEAIRQLEIAGGVEIVKDILTTDTKSVRRTEPERREAVSLLTQITAPWHGADHKVGGLKDCIEGIVEGLTGIVGTTTCCQTLLLCAASFNNLTRLEVTSIYSIMSNESVIKLKEAVDSRGPGVSIFLYEQIVSMLYNMSGNKKCHSHLANRNIINFITSIFQSQFYTTFASRSENDAHHRTIKTILHIFSRLIHESVVGPDILEQNFVPIFSKVESSLNRDSEYSKDISFLSRQLNESLSHKSFNRSAEGRGSTSSNTSTTRFHFSRQESYV